MAPRAVAWPNIRRARRGLVRSRESKALSFQVTIGLASHVGNRQATNTDSAIAGIEVAADYVCGRASLASARPGTFHGPTAHTARLSPSIGARHIPKTRFYRAGPGRVIGRGEESAHVGAEESSAGCS